MTHASDPQPLYTLELKDCSGYVLEGGKDGAVLMKGDPESQEQKWTITNVFHPEDGLSGYTIVNAATTRALKFVDPKKPLAMGASRPPVEVDLLWQLVSPGDDVFWHITSSADTGQAVDAKGSDGCKDGALVQAWTSGLSNNRQLWRIRKTAE